MAPVTNAPAVQNKPANAAPVKNAAASSQPVSDTGSSPRNLKLADSSVSDGTQFDPVSFFGDLEEELLEGLQGSKEQNKTKDRNGSSTNDENSPNADGRDKDKNRPIINIFIVNPDKDKDADTEGANQGGNTNGGGSKGCSGGSCSGSGGAPTAGGGASPMGRGRRANGPSGPQGKKNFGPGNGKVVKANSIEELAQKLQPMGLTIKGPAKDKSDQLDYNQMASNCGLDSAANLAILGGGNVNGQRPTEENVFDLAQRSGLTDNVGSSTQPQQEALLEKMGIAADYKGKASADEIVDLASKGHGGILSISSDALWGDAKGQGDINHGVAVVGTAVDSSGQTAGVVMIDTGEGAASFVATDALQDILDRSNGGLFVATEEPLDKNNSMGLAA